VKELVTVEIKWEKNDKGQFVPKEVPGTEKTRPAQLVLLAMGFLGPEQALLKEINLETDPRSNIKAEHEKYHDQHQGCLRRRRLPPRPEPGRVGDQRRPLPERAGGLRPADKQRP
jgi:NADPH-dependent glutamate synthase beta subunit-like oxidoreductase